MIKEIKADIWDFENDVKIITTNGNVKKDGTAVMGKGLALQASKRYPYLALHFGNYIKYEGNKCIYYPQYKLIMFPTKFNWWEKSNYDLIRKSMKELYIICVQNNIRRVIMPKVGCGNGGLNWSKVKNRIIDILECKDIEFVIV